MRLPLVILFTAVTTYVLVLLQWSLISPATATPRASLRPPPEPLLGGKSRDEDGSNISARIGFMILTTEANHYSRIPLVISTWGKHANIIFIATDAPGKQNRLFIDLGERGMENLGRKSLKMLHKVCEHSPFRDLDFIVMVDDDTFIVTPNLEAFLTTIDPLQPAFFGYVLTHLSLPVVGGGGGIVFSRGAMQGVCAAVKAPGQPENNLCHWESATDTPGDTAVALCMYQLRVPPVHVDGFYPFPVHGMVDEQHNWCQEAWWTPKHLKCPPVASIISFHYLEPERWREVYYWTYIFSRERSGSRGGQSPFATVVVGPAPRYNSESGAL